ncbi:MAG: hypothetical protein R3C49_14490 [Planctomycetaceae bacterium]
MTASVEGLQQLEKVFRRLDTLENAKNWKPMSPHESQALQAELLAKARQASDRGIFDERSIPNLRSDRNSVARNHILSSPSAEMRPQPSTRNPPEQKSLELAKTLRSAETVTDEQRAELAVLVEQSLEARLKQQAEQVEQLRAKLQQVEKALQDRQQNKDRMIQRRVEELLDPSIDWDSVARERSASDPFRAASGFSGLQNAASSTVPRSSKPLQTSPRGDGISEFSRALAGERALSAGTPIGLPGPPHLPQSKPASLPPTPADFEVPRDVSDSDPSARIVRELMAAKTNMERTASAVQDAEKKQAELGQNDGSGQTDRKHQAEIEESLTQELASQRQLHSNAVFVWQQAWKSYEASLKLHNLLSNELRSKQLAAATEHARLTKLF